MNISFYCFLLDTIISAFCLFSTGSQISVERDKQFFNTECAKDISTQMLPKVSIDSVLIIRPEELIQLDYEINEIVNNVKIILVVEDSLLMKSISLRLNNNANTINADTIKVICNSYIMINADHNFNIASGIIVLSRNLDYEGGMFSEQMTTTELILNSDEKVGECGIEKTTTMLTLSKVNDSYIKFINYLPVSNSCKIDLVNYDEFITLNKEAYILLNDQENMTGLIWNSPEGYSGK